MERLVAFVGTLLATLAIATLVAGRVDAADPSAPAPDLFVLDAPFVRTTRVELGFVVRDVSGGPIEEYRAANDPAADNGVLTNGQAVPISGMWQLAAGPDGPRSIYGQVHYESGLWSPIVSLDLVLDTSPGSFMYIDLDPQPGLGYEIHLPPDNDWHEVLRSPADHYWAQAIPAGSADPLGFSVSGGRWSVTYVDTTAPIEPGVHTIPGPVDELNPGPIDAAVSVAFGGDCHGSGTFTINQIDWAPGGDLANLSADFRLQCFSYIMAGSIRYGSSDDVVALDQDLDSMAFGDPVIGETTDPQTLYITNVGTVTTTLGTAAAVDPPQGTVGPAPGDFGIDTDDCSNATLDVGESCAVSVSFSPSAMGYRFARLEIPDQTTRGSRSVRLGGYGVQPTSVAVDAPDPPAYGPATATFVVTVNPSGPTALLTVSGAQVLAPIAEEELTSPSRRRYTYAVTLTPGQHVAVATIESGQGYLGSSSNPLVLDIGIGTQLTLATATDDGVATGEEAVLEARLEAGAALTGGTLTIRDSVTDAVLATGPVSGATSSLFHPVTRPPGSHGFVAEFAPGGSGVQPSSASYQLSVVDGTRPETIMSSSPVVTNTWPTRFDFSSPDAGVTFDCRVDVSNWFACASPAVLGQHNEGSHTFSVRAHRANGLADRTPATRAWILDYTPPSGSFSLAQGATYTTSPRVTIQARASDYIPGTDIVTVPARLWVGHDRGGVINRPFSRLVTIDLQEPDGVRQVSGYFSDAAGNISSITYTSITLDTHPPSVSGPIVSLRSGTSGMSGTVPARVSWAGSDATSGVSRYELAMSTDGGSWMLLGDAFTTTAHDRGLAPRHSYRFRVRAVDNAGNIGGWATGPTLSISRYSENSPRITFTKSWATTTASGYWGGAAKQSSRTGAKASFTFTGRSFAWVSHRGPDRGKAEVYVNGTRIATIDLHASTHQDQIVVWARNWSSVSPRTVVIRVPGTSGRPRVDVDEFVTSG